ncbi:hypothetical protein FJTKL_00452 [Diaporthe vaccinii]|uniref:AAA+ ATPase domain-containing protein n=1 Tax=Diaporthe vaccinii TaxID=105482 RepID=A0ABR4E2Z2_9PEZI
MADAKDQAGVNSVSDGDVHKSIPVGVETIAALLQSLTIGINGLVKRVGALEQSQGIDYGTKNSKKDPGNNEPTRGKNEPGTTTVSTTGTTSSKHDEDIKSKGASLLCLVEYREKVYIDRMGKFDWKVLSAEADQKTTLGRVSFRYDTDENGKLAFSVFKTAKIFQWLYDHCPPAAHGQVNVLRDALVFEDAFPLLHLRQDLNDYKEKLGNDKTENANHKPIQDEIEVLDQLYSQKGHFKDALDQYNTMCKTRKIDFRSLKGLSRKDQLVVFRELRDELAVARVTLITATDENDRYGRDVKLDLDCKTIDFDGKRFRYHLYRKTIDVFTGSRNITELDVYPLEYSHEKDDIIRKSIDSGGKWWDLHKKLTDAHGQSSATVMHYDGYCETFGENARDENGGKGSQLVTRVIVDTMRFPDRFLRFTEEDMPSPDKDPESLFASKGEDNPYVLCPERVLVHSLSDNEWYYVAMTWLVNPVWDSKAWETLVMPRTYASASEKDDIAKSISPIRELARAHKEVTKKDERMDNFKGKGKGLTFLLHGPPGVGKTMLAECLSEDQQRPLYRINLGRLIAEANWESKIDEIFRQAHSWDAILLVDEAEVILVERTQENMEQSAWVAVFLRKIEYFEGIIFLTTNLIHMIGKCYSQPTGN